MSGEYRYVWRIAFRNFINSLRPRQIRGNAMGTDYIGNKYFEIPAEPSLGKRKPTRWYDPPKGLDFENKIPSEWEAWLRMRRDNAPTEEEIAQNMAMAKMKKENAAKLEAKRLAEGGDLPVAPERGHLSFPKYEEYHAGDPEGKRFKE
ncbi:NADH dehydrogenase [ubiquinone] 1 alpha subcomplex assembly factor 2 [Pectinophora gossypiella]|uniref:NADH dehydrogenase [ubiquinone] 1 alpha subcomplex assembly factor 2 n=2 Tax=Pectinophora gossypiella TaxID=13191 RepID=A0A1E1WGE6_PECGO|nr:NADH dehydrogenase [ubiquinone] 1 alpha subcomplex assembly factor 2 [Pectinophora gossypiella]